MLNVIIDRIILLSIAIIICVRVIPNSNNSPSSSIKNLRLLLMYKITSNYYVLFYYIFIYRLNDHKTLNLLPSN